MMESLQIPNKSLFKVDEVCSIVGIKPYVLRFWESEFEEIVPVTGSNGRKMYEHKDIEAISKVKKLLFEDKLTIQKAKVILGKKEELPELPSEAFEEEESAELSFSSDDQIKNIDRAKACLKDLISEISTLQSNF